MKGIVLYIATAFIAALFMSGQAFAAGESYTGGERGTVEERHSDIPEGGVSGTEGLTTGVQLNDEQIREMQMILQDSGYDVEVSGELDSDTSSAIREFQRSEGLVVSGQPDEDTLRALAPSAEQQEFFGLSPEFGEEERTFEEQESLEERESLEETPMGEERIEGTPPAVD